MKITAFVDDKNEDHALTVDDGAVVRDVLEKLDINPVTVIVTRESSVITSGAGLQDGDSLTILSVISGG